MKKHVHLQKKKIEEKSNLMTRVFIVGLCVFVQSR